MTAAALPRTALRSESRVGATGLAWLILRQHRALILGTVAAAAALSVYLLAWRLLAGGAANVISVYGPETALRYGVIVFSLVVAAFWGAPLLSREYEQRTHLLVWSQDVSAVRWLLTKAALLGVLVVGLAVGLEAVGELVQGQIQLAISDQGWMANTYLLGFEESIPLQAAYALAAFALGLAIGGLVRVPVLAMVASVGVFGLIRWLMADYVRHEYLPTLQANSFMGTYGGDPLDGRLPDARLIELGSYLGIAVLCVAVACFGVRRRQRV